MVAEFNQKITSRMYDVALETAKKLNLDVIHTSNVPGIFEIPYIISKNINVSTMTIFWQFIIKGIEEMSIVSNQLLCLEMLVLRLIHLKEMPDYQEVLNSISESSFKNDNEEEIKSNVDQTKKYLDMVNAISCRLSQPFPALNGLADFRLVAGQF